MLIINIWFFFFIFFCHGGLNSIRKFVHNYLDFKTWCRYMFWNFEKYMLTVKLEYKNYKFIFKLTVYIQQNEFWIKILFFFLLISGLQKLATILICFFFFYLFFQMDIGIEFHSKKLVHVSELNSISQCRYMFWNWIQFKNICYHHDIEVHYLTNSKLTYIFSPFSFSFSICQMKFGLQCLFAFPRSRICKRQ